MDITEVRRSELYNTLSWMGLLSTEEYRIREVRNSPSKYYIDLDLENTDIERVGYLYPHVKLKSEYKDVCELWYEDKYINPKRCTWIDTNNGTYCITDKAYDDQKPVTCFINPSIIIRYTNISDNPEQDLEHVVDIDTSDLIYSNIINIEHCAYYISQNKVRVPTIEWLDAKILRFHAPYKEDIDFFLCSNVVNVVEATANTGVYLDQPHSNKCYHEIFVDQERDYPIDARFYPCIAVDKDCTIRVFSYNSHTILYPDVCRLILYPEFLDVDDPYNTDRPGMADLPKIDDCIKSSDSDVVIETKFSHIAQYFYRMWEKLPVDTTEQSDFIICDNGRLGDEHFLRKIVSLYDSKDERIVSTIPVEEFRDVLLYDGMMFNDYIIRNIRVDAQGSFVEDNKDGTPRYIIGKEYDEAKFTLIKFNTGEDTTIMNIGDYIDPNNIAQLHRKVNRFYRNLLLIRSELLDVDQQDKVHIGTKKPTMVDEYLWYELLINANPEMFKNHLIDAIHIFGLDEADIPDDIKEGAYKIDMDPMTGPKTYTELMMTYFNLTKSYRKYLVLQMGDGVDDPRIQIFHKIHTGKVKNPEMNTMTIETDTEETVETEYETGFKDHPVSGEHRAGNLYVQAKYIGDDTNTHIDRIELGPNTPAPDEHTLWIDAPSSSINGITAAPNELDSTTEIIDVVNDPNTIKDPKKSDYALDSIDDTLDEDSEISIDDLFGDDTNFDDDDEVETGDEPDDPNMMSGISAAIAENRQASDVSNPTFGMLALDDISYYNEETGKTISMEDIAKMPHDEKVGVAKKFITDDDTPTNANIGDLWVSYLNTSSEEVLNTVVYKILLSAYVLGMDKPKTGTLVIEGDTLPEEEDSVAIGDSTRHTAPNQLLIHTDFNAMGEEIPDYEIIKKEALTYILSVKEPDNPKKNDIWLSIPASFKVEIIIDVISHTLEEFGEELPEGYFYDDGYEASATMGFDYFAHDKGTLGLGEEFQESSSDKLNKIIFDNEIESTDIEDNDIWFEFLDDIDNRVVYSDENSMVVRVDERLILINFNREGIIGYAFDDILINFRGKQGIRYLSIISDLINSGVITKDDIDIFYKRLITFHDEFDPNLKRLYTGTSHVLSTTKVDMNDFAILYSSNIGRFRMNYADDTTTNTERAGIYQLCIDYRDRDFAFLKNRMLLFVNGKYVPRNNYKENFPGKIQLLDWNEIITTVDILYSKKDQHLMDMKKLAMTHSKAIDMSKMIERPSKFEEMVPIEEYDQTMKGYYDILLDEYILNGKLIRILNYLEEHPDEANDYRKDMIRKFRDIADTGLSGMDEDDARIVIPTNTDIDIPPYQIGVDQD